MVSNRCAVRCELSCIDSLTLRASGLREANEMPSRIGMQTSGTSASLPPTSAMTIMYSSMKGRSPSTVSVLVAKNSRTDSKSRTVLASTPPEAGRSAARMRRHCAKTLEDSATSMRRAAVSSRLLRSRRITNSKPVSKMTGGSQHAQAAERVVGDHTVVHRHAVERNQRAEDVQRDGAEQGPGEHPAVALEGVPEPAANLRQGVEQAALVEVELRPRGEPLGVRRLALDRLGVQPAHAFDARQMTLHLPVLERGARRRSGRCRPSPARAVRCACGACPRPAACQ